MIAELVLILALGASPDTPTTEPAARAAEIALRSAEEEVERQQAHSSLIDRLLDSARQAYEEGRFEDAVGIARRARLVASRRGRETTRTTPPVRPTTEALYDALERLVSAENRGGNDAGVMAARELVGAAEAAMDAGNVNQAENLARRALLMLAALPPPRLDTTTIADRRLDLNLATREELRSVPGLTEEMIRNVVWFRTWIGPFRAVEEMRFVPGFDADWIVITARYLKVNLPQTGNTPRR